MSDFGKELININVDNETLRNEIISRITPIDDPTFDIKVNTDEVFSITVQFKDVTETFEIFEVTSESIDVTLHKINEFVKGVTQW